jgi:5-(carboxyamino)imidazole ribonucleotide synthase
VRIGVLGGGQLGRMLALAGIPHGHTFVFLEPGGEAVRGLGEVIAAPADHSPSLARLVSRVDVVTYEFENVPVSAAHFVAARRPVHPPPDALRVSQDRLVEKRFFRELGVPTPEFVAIDTRPALDDAVSWVVLTSVLKSLGFF